MEFGIVADITESTLGIIELARAVEEAGLESLFLTQPTHVLRALGHCGFRPLD